MQTFIGFLRDLGWGVTIGIVVLLVGGAFFYFEYRGTTKKEKADRRAEPPHVIPTVPLRVKSHKVENPKAPAMLRQWFTELALNVRVDPAQVIECACQGYRQDRAARWRPRGGKWERR